MVPAGCGVAALGLGGGVVTDEVNARPGRVRRRRANVPGGRTKKHEVWVSAEEEAELYQRALRAGVGIPRLLAEAAMADVPGETMTDRRKQLTELFRLHRTLAGAANNLNQIARATNAEGMLPVELRAALASTMAEVRTAAEHVQDVIEANGLRS